MVNTNIKFTYADYRSIPESETRRYELLEGALVMVPSPGERHQSISGNLEFILQGFVRVSGLGRVYHAPFDVVLSNEEVVQPDILFVSKERSHIITPENIQGAPDLVIEIISPATAERDRSYKRTIYARHGIREYWLVDPENEAVEVLGLGEKGFNPVGTYKGKETLKSPLLPELAIDLSEVF